jgi:hypothetical protein
MSAPQIVFLDTTVYAGQAYNFDSTVLTTFVAAAKRRGSKLLLPDPTDREVRRHIREKSNEALAALNEARRSAPFLKKWAHFPKKAFPAIASWEVSQIAQGEWSAFLKQLPVEKLGYDGINVAKVMTWYDEIKPPFGQGKKRKEFPDAFAIAILDKFAADHSCAIAVVSDDQDIKLACDSRPTFLHFASLPRLTERLVTGDDKLETLREAILGDLSALDDAVRDEAAGNLTYYHADRRYEIEESDFETLDITDARIVALGQRQATVAFEATIEVSHKLRWQEQVYDDDYRWESATCVESGPVSGTAKVELDTNTQAISSVTYLELDQTELEVTETPRHRW